MDTRFQCRLLPGHHLRQGGNIQISPEDGSVVNQKFSGKSVNNYYRDMSRNVYQITGDVVGWVQVPHSVWWYGADPCPGARSGGTGHNGGVPGAGGARTLVMDTLEAVKRAYPQS